MPANQQDDPVPGVVALVDEAVHLLRRFPRRLAVYYAGTGAFAVGLLYFWADTTWTQPTEGSIAAGSLGLTLLFVAMKTAQHRFARQLWADLTRQPAPAWTLRQAGAEAIVQLRLQASGAVLLPFAAVFGVPFGWIYAYYQTAAVLPPTEQPGSVARRSKAWSLATLWPGQNHCALAIFSGVWLVMFMNVGSAFYTVPHMLTSWLGIKTVFAVTGWDYLNTTFLALIATLTHLLVDPLIKTFYLLRVYYAQARTDGTDLQVVVDTQRVRSRPTQAGLAVVALVLLLGSVPAMRAEPPPPAVSGPVFDRAVNEVLERPDYRWRLRPLPGAPAARKEGVVSGFFRTTMEVISQMLTSAANGVRRAWHWVENLLPASKDRPDQPADNRSSQPFDWAAVVQFAAIIVICITLGFFLFVAWKVWRQSRLTPALPAASGPAAAPAPDLRDEQTVASQLQPDGWVLLAREQIAAGNWRLALRALFLSLLARHGQRGLLRLARHKTNLDYERELRRRTHGEAATVDDFSVRRRQFEDVWYGSTPAEEAQVRAWLAQSEQSP